MRTRAAVVTAPGRGFEVTELELDGPRDGEVLVCIGAAGVCHSDWHLVTGATKHVMPVVAGHEGAGVVEAIGDGVTSVKVGDRVALSWAPACGACFYCTHGRPALCKTYVGPIWAGTMMDGTTRLRAPEFPEAPEAGEPGPSRSAQVRLGGGPVYAFSALGCFAERAVVPQSCCVPMAADVPMEVAALIGCAVTTGVGAVVNTAKVEAGSSVAVFGVGGVGLSTVMGAAAMGAATVIAIDRTESKAAMAMTMGATAALAIGGDTADRVRAMTEGRGVDYALDTTGLPAVQRTAYDATRPGGTLVVIGLAGGDDPLAIPAADLVRTEKTIAGCYYGSADASRDFVRFADWYRAGRLPLDRLVTKRYPLDRINEAYDAMLTGETARGVIVFE